MVSVDHFVYELRRRLHEAAANGASELLLTSHELCRSARSGTAWLNACCEAMEQEIRDGDLVVQPILIWGLRAGPGSVASMLIPILTAAVLREKANGAKASINFFPMAHQWRGSRGAARTKRLVLKSAR